MTQHQLNDERLSEARKALDLHHSPSCRWYWGPPFQDLERCDCGTLAGVIAFEATITASLVEENRRLTAMVCRCGRPIAAAFAGTPDVAIYTRWHDPDRPEYHKPEPEESHP